MEFIISLIAGAVGGNAAGAVAPRINQGTLVNSVAGILGGGRGGAILSAVGLGGVADAVCSKNGVLIPEGRYDLFAKSLVEKLRDPVTNSDTCRAHASKFSWKNFNESVQGAIFGVLSDYGIE